MEQSLVTVMTSVESSTDILVVHISDLHIFDSDSIALARLSQMAGAIGQCVERPSHILILVTGDIAYSGKAEQYGLAAEALEKLIEDLSAWNPISVRLYCCPGNHDCDFDSISPKVHQSLLKDIGTDYEDVISVVKELTTTQSEFNVFRDVVCGESVYQNEVLSTVVLDYDGRTVSLSMLNSSWSSKKEENPGALRMPAIIIPNVDMSSDIAIGMIHHPINWYSPEDVRTFSGWLDRNVDVALWGHEHLEDDVERKRKNLGSSVRNFLASPIEDKSATCGFSVFAISGIAAGLVKSSFVWKGDRVALLRREDKEALPKNPGRLLNKLRFTYQFHEFLDDPGGSFQHPRLTRNLRLSEILIFPELRSLDEATSESDSLAATSSMAEVLAAILGEDRVVIFGAEQSGKTTIAKMAISEANRTGLLPLYLDAANLKSVNQAEITGWINAGIRYQFEKDCIDDVMQKNPSERILIIDNFHQVPAGSQGIAKVLDRVQTLATRQLVLSSDSPATAVLAADYEGDADSAYWTGAKTFEVLALGHKQRGELIRRWVSIGRDDVISKDAIEHEARQTKATLDHALGKDSVPKYPMFILILLQHIEIGRDVNTAVTNGSHGFLFEALITKWLDAHAKSHPINTTHDYLAKLANEMWRADVQSLDRATFSKFHEGFVSLSLVDISKDLLLRDLEKARVFVNDSRGVSFRYPYLYYYYLARWITSERGEGSGLVMDRLVEHIHTEKSANVLMFVAYREHENEVLDRLLPLAKSLYKDINLSTLEDYSALSLRFRTVFDRNVLLLGKPDVVSDEHNRRHDDVERSKGDGRHATDTEIKDSLNINTSMKTMQVLGQILRSRASAISVERKLEIADETIALARRMMAYLCDFIEDSSDQLVHLISDAFEKALALNREDAIKYANQVIGMLVVGISRMCLGRAAAALASSELRPLLNVMEDRLTVEDEKLVILLARVASEIEYPDNGVNAFVQRAAKSDILSRGLLAWSVSRRFYLDPPPHALRDSACKRLGIEQKSLPARLAGLPGKAPRY